MVSATHGLAMGVAQMNRLGVTCGVLTLILLAIGPPGILLGQSNRAIDVSRSTLKVHVFKSGLFSPFAHDHEIEAPITEGAADLATPAVTLRVDARKLRVPDPGASATDRAQIQKTMEGPPVLDSERFPQISFHSAHVEKLGE